MKPDPCWCGEYAFPHRLLGGRCNGDGQEKPVPWDLKGEVPKDYGTETNDDKYNDPRRGEAAAINAQRYFW